MNAAVIDSPLNEQAQTWWFLDLLVVEHRCAPGMKTVVLEMTLPVGSSPPLHVHHSLDDTWYILDGKMVVRCGDDVMVVGAGHWAVDAARSAAHLPCRWSREARILLVHDNASFRDLIREVGVPAASHVVPAQPVFLPKDDLSRVADSHDLTPVGPPMGVEEADAALAAAH